MTYATAIAQGSRDLRAKLIATDITLIDEIKTIQFVGALTSGKNFEIGTAIASRFTATLNDIDETIVDYDFKSKEFDLQFGINIGTTLVPVWEYYSVGLFTVTETTRDAKKYTLKAMDRMHLMDEVYVGTLEYPAELGTILQDACDQAGITLATTTFANSTYSIEKPSYAEATCRKVAEQIAELAGGYATVNAAGELVILTIDMAGTTKVITDATLIKITQDETAISTIDTVTVKVGDVKTTVGSGTNTYTVANNIFVQNPADVADALYAVLNGLTYSQMTIKWLGDYKTTLGQRYQIDVGGETYYTFNFSRTITFNGGIREETTAPARSDIIKNGVLNGPVKLAINQLKTEINLLDGKIELNVENLENEISTAQSQIVVLQGQIATKVSTTDLETALTDYTTITQTDEKISISVGTVQTQVTDQKATIDNVNTNFDFTGEGLTIRRSGNPFQISISNEQMDFVNNGFTTAYINGTKMYIANLEILNEIKMAYHNIYKYEAGTMTLVTFGG